MDYVADVVIPARNEAGTLPNVILAFKAHPAIGKVIVVIDGDTTDNTWDAAYYADMRISHPDLKGKGQCVSAGLTQVITPYVIFCDADITGLSEGHVGLLLDAAISAEVNRTKPFMTVGVPELPDNLPTSRLWAWPWVSGQRCVPTALVRPLNLHGYLMETQINSAAKHASLSLRFEWLRGVRSAYNMTDQRLQEMERDAVWGQEHGIL